MSKGHTAVNEFLRDKVRFADYFNGNFFQGRQIIMPEDLEEAKGETDILVEDGNRQVVPIQRYRDITMKWRNETYLTLLACESQSKVHYAMPVRGMLYDSLSYVGQAKEIWESHREDVHQSLSGAEYLSHFRKDDKLVPVISAVFYYGLDAWDGSTDLYGMFRNHSLFNEEVLQQYIPNYKLNLFDVNNIQSVDCFRSDLKEILGMMKCRNDKDALINYMDEHRDYFQCVTGGVHRVIGEFLQSKTLLNKTVTRVEEKEGVNMCKALDDLYHDGFEQGIEQGEDRKLMEQVQKKLQKGCTIPEIAEMLEESEEVIEKVVNRLS